MFKLQLVSQFVPWEMVDQVVEGVTEGVARRGGEAKDGEGAAKKRMIQRMISCLDWRRCGTLMKMQKQN